MATKIEWCDETINPVTGCTRISPACDNCYAIEMMKKDGKNPHQISFKNDQLKKLQKWRKSKVIFVVSMGDIFHQNVSDEYIDLIFAFMNRSPHHKYLILTKRAERMLFYCQKYCKKHNRFPRWVWLGVTAEDQLRADYRLSLLLQTPAYHHFVSVEPMLGPIKLPFGGKYPLDWVIVGGEKAGNKARLMHPDWARDVRDQCNVNDVPFFLKQMTNELAVPADLNIKQFPQGLR
jgi:protein gp37